MNLPVDKLIFWEKYEISSLELMFIVVYVFNRTLNKYNLILYNDLYGNNMSVVGFGT